MMLFRNLILVIAIFLHLIPIQGQRIINEGEVTGLWTKDESPYFINGDITIPESGSLVIEPGVKVLFNGFYSIMVYGQLNASGTITDSIEFNSSNDTINWHRIRFNGAKNTNTFNYCNFQHMYSERYSPVDPMEEMDFPEIGEEKKKELSGGICLFDSAIVYVTNSKFYNNSLQEGACIYSVFSSPVIQYNHFFNNNQTGTPIIACHEKAKTDIFLQRNKFYNNIAGTIIVLSNSAAICSHNLIRNNQAYSLIMEVWEIPSVISNNLIVHNTIHGNLLSTMNGIIKNNTICNNITETARIFTIYSKPKIYNNIFYGNAALENEQLTVYSSYSQPEIFNNIVQGEFMTLVNNNYYDTTLYKNNIDTDPLFIAPTNGAGYEYDASESLFSLSYNSPAVNAGVTNLPYDTVLSDEDYYGNKRIAGSEIDIGACELVDIDFALYDWSYPKVICNSDEVHIELKIRNFGASENFNFTVSYSIDGGTTFFTEEYFYGIQPGESYLFKSDKKHSFDLEKDYTCIAVVKASNDQNPSNDTLITTLPFIFHEFDLGEDISLCAGENKTVYAPNGFESHVWKNDNEIISTSPIIAQPTKSGTYTLSAVSNNGCVSTDSIIVTINDNPEQPFANDVNYCIKSEDISLHATGTNIHWYANSDLQSTIGSGNDFKPTGIQIGTSTYYATQTNNITGCESDGTSVKLTVTDVPEAPVTNSVTILKNELVPSLSAVGTDVKWYNDSSLTKLLNKGTTFASNDTETGKHTYFVTQTLNSCESEAAQVYLEILDEILPPEVNDVTNCEGESIELKADGVNITWYSDELLTNKLHSGDKYQLSHNSPGEFIYYATQTINSIQGSPATIHVKIITRPEPPAGKDVTVYDGDEIPPLSVTGDNINWYNNLNHELLLATGEEFKSSDTTIGVYFYYVTQTINDCESNDAEISLGIISNIPTITDSMCLGEERKTIDILGENIEWYNSNDTNTVIHTGNSYTPDINAPGDHMWYVTQTINQKKSAPTKIRLKVFPDPEKPIFDKNNGNYCPGDTIRCKNFINNLTYSWVFNDAPIINENIGYYIPSETANGNIQLYVTNEKTGCKNNSDILSIVNTQPEIVLKGDNILICLNLENIFHTYQWYRNDEVIQQSNEQFHVAKFNGDYFVLTENENNCALKSNIISLTGINSYSIAPTITKDKIKIICNHSDSDSEYRITIYSSVGQILLTKKSSSKITELDIESFKSGLYFIHVLSPVAHDSKWVIKE